MKENVFILRRCMLPETYFKGLVKNNLYIHKVYLFILQYKIILLRNHCYLYKINI